MKTRTTYRLLILFVFFAGLGLGGVGGFFVNDYLERENPDAIQQIRQEFETQQNLDDFFAQQRTQQANDAVTD